MIRRSPEFAMQCFLFTWARYSRRKYPQLDLLSCSLNGVKLTKAQAGKAKAAGMLAGEHDVKLPVRRGKYIGLSIELKHGKNKPTPDQLWYAKRLTEEGWCVRFCWSWVDASEIIKAYLEEKISDGVIHPALALRPDRVGCAQRG